jgi:hypothetical protein
MIQPPTVRLETFLAHTIRPLTIRPIFVMSPYDSPMNFVVRFIPEKTHYHCVCVFATSRILLIVRTFLLYSIILLVTNKLALLRSASISAVNNTMS